MRVALAIGNADPDPDRPNEQQDDNAKRRFRASSLLVSLKTACEEKGWDADIVLIGENVKQTIDMPDVFVNLICEPMAHVSSLKVLETYERQLPISVMNPSRAINLTSRLILADTLTGQENVRVPRTTLFDSAFGTLTDHAHRAGHPWPVLVRPLGTHGGEGLVKVDDQGQAEGSSFNGTRTVTDYVDFASPDGCYRKYRSIWVNGQVFRRHVIVSDDWNIKGESRVFMRERADLIAEEKAWLAAETGELDRRIGALFKASGLDFGVIDFALGPGGEITVFELNACFQISGSIPEDKRERWGYLEDSNQPIVDALLMAMESRAES